VSRPRLAPAALAFAFLALPAFAQDTRTVSEPIFPIACATLNAQLSSPKGVFSDSDEAKLDTARIQKAIDACKQGQAVELAMGGTANAFLTGPLELRTGVTLLLDKGVTLYGSRDPKIYENSPGSCGIVTQDNPHGCKPLISVLKAPHAAIMGDGILDGRGGANLLGQSKSWWDLANDARDNRHQQVPRLIDINKSDDFTLYRITLKNSAMFHVVFAHGDGFTVWGLKIDTPKNARNTDGVDPSASKNITVTQSFIRTGDDNIAIKGGDGPVTHMSVSNNHFFYGHGMSIGSETNAGVSQVVVDHLTLDGTESGIRIKSNPTRGGLVDDITYKNICIRDSNHPIQLETAYNNPGAKVDAFPVYKNIHVQNVVIASSHTISLNGFDHDHRIAIQFDGVALDHPSDYKFQVKHADITFGPGPVNFQVPLQNSGGEDSTVAGKAPAAPLPTCTQRFVPFPTTP
jgi:polygalacturonase